MTGPTPATRRAVIERDEGRCVVTGAYLVDPHTLRPYGQYSLQHRRPRGLGGSRDPIINDPVNLILVDGTGTTGVHGRIESQRRWAREQGYAVSHWENPALVPVRHWLHGLAFLTSDGWLPIPPGADGVLLAAEHGERVARAAGMCDDDVAHISSSLRELAETWAGAA